MYPWMDEVNESYQKYYKDGALLDLKWTQEEEEAVDLIMTDLETYIDENIAAFIKGTKSMDEYDAFVTGLDGLGINELQALYQTRYERQLASME
jgi:putative aldouronate transport system substrate-binding protein